MLYFLIATGDPTSLRPKFENALRWFSQTVPLADPTADSRISEDGRWFVLACGAADAFASSRVRIGQERALAINGPALRLDGDTFGDATVDKLFRDHGRQTTSLFRDLSGAFCVGSIDPHEGLVGCSSFDNIHPIYYIDVNGFCAISNRATALARLVDSEPDPRALCWLVAASNLFGPPTAFKGVHKVGTGEAVTAEVGSMRLVRRSIPGDVWPEPDTPGRANLSARDWDRLTERLVADVRAACETGEDRIDLAITGGKDSRLVLGLALAAGVLDRTRIFTRGLPSWGDSTFAMEVCRRIGATHQLEVPKNVGGRVKTRPWSSMRVHVSRYEGIVCPWDGPGPANLPGRSVSLEGVGGELYRGSGGHAKQFKRFLPDTVPSMQKAFVDYHQRFDPVGLLRPQVAEEMKAWLFDWVRDTARLVRLDTLPERFFIDYRVGHWNGPLNQNLPGRVRVSALLDLACARAILELAPEVRATEKFHYEIMRRVAPALLHVPFYQDRWNNHLVPPSRRIWDSLKVRFGAVEPLLVEKPPPQKGWQWDFAETSRGRTASLLSQARDRGLEEVLDVDRAMEWVSADGPMRDMQNVKTFLSLTAICLMLLGGELPAQDDVR